MDCNKCLPLLSIPRSVCEGVCLCASRGQAQLAGGKGPRGRGHTPGKSLHPSPCLYTTHPPCPQGCPPHFANPEGGRLVSSLEVMKSPLPRSPALLDRGLPPLMKPSSSGLNWRVWWRDGIALQPIPAPAPPQGLAQALMPHWSFSDPQDTGGRGASPTDGVGGGWAAPPVPGPLSRGGPGRATVRLGLGKLGIVRGHGAMGRGAHPPSSPPGPAPCRCLCGAELPAPGPAEACCPPRPGASLTSQGQEPVLPGMPGSSQRTLFPRGSGSPRILSILLLGRRAGPPPCPHLCLNLTPSPHWPPTDSLCHSL